MYVSLKSNTVIFLFARPGYDINLFLNFLKKETLDFLVYDVRRMVSKIPFKSDDTKCKVDKMAYSGDSLPVKYVHKAVFVTPFPKNKLIIFLTFPEQKSHADHFRENIPHDPERTFSITLNHGGWLKEMRRTIGKGRHSENVYVKMATRYDQSSLNARWALRLPEENHFGVEEIPDITTAREIISKFKLNQFRQSPTLF